MWKYLTLLSLPVAVGTWIYDDKKEVRMEIATNLEGGKKVETVGLSRVEIYGGRGPCSSLPCTEQGNMQVFRAAPVSLCTDACIALWESQP